MMKTIAFVRTLRGLPQGAQRLVPALGLLLGLAFLGPLTPASAQTGFSGGDSDSVGSLPIEEPEKPTAGSHGLDTNAGGQAGDDVRLADHFRMRMSGSEVEIRRLILAATGVGHVLREELDDQGTVAYTFVGTVRVTLDRARLKQSFVTVEMAIGPVFTGGRSVVHAGQRKASQLLHTGTFDLHLRQLAKSGLTDAGVHVEAWSRQRFPDGHNARLTAQADRAAIVLTQQPTPAVR